MSRRRSRILVAGIGGALIAVAWGCNAILGLDDVARPLREEADGDVAPDSAVEASTVAVSARCLGDLDCPVLDPCLTPRCEVSTGRCLYATCQPKACQRASCGQGPPRACTQTVEPYDIVAGDLGLPGVTVGCGADATACFAAVYPFAFLGTTAGVIALPVSDLKQLEPPRVKVVLPFSPLQIVASGDVVYFLGPVAGGKLSLAALRVPTDPRLSQLTPVVSVVSYPFASARLYPAMPGEVFLVFADPAAGYPTVILDATLRGGKPIVHVPAPLDAGLASTVDPGAATAMYGAYGPSFGDHEAGSAPETVATSSLGRLLLVQAGAPPRHAIITAAGTSKATIGPELTAYSLFPQQDYGTPPHYATGPDGTVIAFGSLKGPFDTTRFYASTVGTWLLDPTITRIGGFDYFLLYYRFGEYDGGAFDAAPPFQGRALPMGGESAFFVSTLNATSPSGLTVSAAHRLAVTGEPLYPGKLTVFDDPTGDMPPGTVGVAKAAELALVLRKAPNGVKILALDSRCAPK